MAFKRTPLKRTTLKRNTGISCASASSKCIAKIGGSSCATASSKGLEKKRSMFETYKKIDEEREQICTGCGCSQCLSHSHIISRKDKELCDDPRNITFHCLPMNERNGCAWKWEQVGLRCSLMDYIKNMEFIKEVRPDVFAQSIVADYSFFEKNSNNICYSDNFDYLCREFKKLNYE